MERFILLSLVALMFASCGNHIKTINNQTWLVDAQKNRVLVQDRKAVEKQIEEHGFKPVFNHYAGISDGTPDPLAKKLSARQQGESDLAYGRRILTEMGHPAAGASDDQVIFIAKIIIEREANK